MRRIAFCLVACGSAGRCGHLHGPPIRTGRSRGRPEGPPQAGADAKSRDDLAGKLTRREVQRSPSSVPGREIVQVETLIPVGVESGWHVHPGEEVGYIIAGQIAMMVQGRATVVLRAGDKLLVPRRTPHNARDLGPETGRMLSTYIVEAGPDGDVRGPARSEVRRSLSTPHALAKRTFRVRTGRRYANARSRTGSLP